MNEDDKIILQTRLNIAWLPKPNESQIVLSATPPPLHLVSTALTLAFQDDCILMTHLTHRGWDILDGHCTC